MKIEKITKLKNSLLTSFVAVLFFVISPQFILAEDLLPIDPPVLPDVNSNQIIEATSTVDVATTTEENREQLSSTTTEEIPQNFLSFNSLSENSSGAVDTISATNTITVNLNIRYKDILFFSGPIALVKDATTTVIDSANANVEVITSTVFGALNQVDGENANFNLSDFTYYNSMQAIFISCLEVATTSNSSLEKACGYWKYVVNGEYSYLGVDQYNLVDGDNIYFYFGSPRADLLTSTVIVGESFVAIAKTYDYQNNIYVPAPNYTIGITQPDPNNPWSPIVLFSTTSDSLGQGIFTINQVGSYGVGIAEDYYSILENLSVVATSSNSNATTTATSTDSTSGNNSSKTEKIDGVGAVAFLHDNQNPTGSFGDDLYTDWAAIGLAATGKSSDKTLIKNYLISHNFSAESLTDYERHAMALMSLGINPYTGTKINYISKISAEFNGEYFGSGAINENIFALFPLLNAGYDSSDPEISKTVAYLISKQITDSDGGGYWVDVDITAATIQALVLVQDLPGVNTALEKAKTYLRNHQRDGAGFDNGSVTNSNVSSTVWVLQALVALGESQEDWIKNGKTIENYLASKQGVTGGLVDVGIDSVWATSYLLPAYYEKTWDELMTNFKKPKIETSSKSSSSVDEESVLDSVSDEVVILENLDEVEINNEISTVVEPKLSTLKNVLGETGEDSDEKVSPHEENNLQANVLGGVSESGLLEIVSSFIDTTLAGLSTMLGFIALLFKI